MKLWNAVPILLAMSPVPAAAQAAPQPIVLGHSFIIRSAAFGDDRTVNVRLPDGYDGHPEIRYPVLYLIDGGTDQDFVHIAGTVQLGAIWGGMQDVILVGIASKDRRSELTGPTADKDLLARYPSAGHSAVFRTFLRDELKPIVAARYRTNGHDGVIGESLAGLFIAETWLREPGLFENYAAISPSLWWDKEALSREAASLIGPRQAGHRLLLATANEGADMLVPVDRFVDALGAARGWCYAPNPGLTHATIYHAVSPIALQFLFPPATAPDPQTGFEIPCSRKS
jgi:predicted alpha/beta superfamily hydrolase